MIYYDIIGDIHGHASKLAALLLKLGYEKKKNCYQHPERKVVFVGDYIDRGPEIPEVLKCVRSMVDEGHAIALMGNHEYNAICYHTENDTGGHLRTHTDKNKQQHSQTLQQFQHHNGDLLDYVEWFKTLPLWYENNNFRAVHACWNQESIDPLFSLLSGALLNYNALIESATEGTILYHLVEEILKGKELQMPAGKYFYDKDGHKRYHIRIKWWLKPSKTSYRELSVIPMDDKLPSDKVVAKDDCYYKEDQKPVFFGHYWLQGEPNLYRNNVCCLDYSVARKGHLAAYRYDGEEELSNDKFVWV